MQTQTFVLTPPEQKRLRDHMLTGNYLSHPVAYSSLSGKREGLTFVLYTSGKLVVQGKAAEDWIQFVLEPEVLQRVVTGLVAEESRATLFTPHIGIDESGKGDFFGPMVIAAFLTTPEMADWFDQLGVKDSKRIPSDLAIARIAAELTRRFPKHAEVISLSPPTYNRLVAKMGSVNRVLAWGHAKALETLLERHPGIQRAVADQFGPEHQIRNALGVKGKTIVLEQRHKAESDPAVAAASILARDRFVKDLAALGEQVDQVLPKGATIVRPTGEALVKAKGPEVLAQIAKTHFRTTRQVLEACGHAPDLLGTPEPKAWTGPHRS
jgi:ribonuclease HIII